MISIFLSLCRDEKMAMNLVAGGVRGLFWAKASLWTWYPQKEISHPLRIMGKVSLLFRLVMIKESLKF
jgi:hypothetical protein